MIRLYAGSRPRAEFVAEEGMPTVCVYQRFLPPDPSGAGKQAVTLARSLRASGWDVTFLTDDRPDAADHPAIDGSAVVRVAPPPEDPSYPELLAYWFRLANALRSHRDFDVLHVHAADFVHSAAVPIARMLGRPVLVRSSISGEFDNLTQSRSGRLQRAMFAGAGAFVVLSRRIADEFGTAGMPASRLSLIPNGVDTGVYHPVDRAEQQELRKALDLPLASRILVYHGVFIERKSLLWIIDVLEQHLERLNLTLVLVGGATRERESVTYAERLRARVATSSAQGRILLRPHDPTPDRYLKAGDAYVLASTAEGLSNALLEAMACGLMPIASNTGGSEDVIQHGVSGLLFPPGDADRLERTIESAFGSAPTVDRVALGRAAAERVQGEFSIRASAERYIRIYDRLRGAGRNGTSAS